VAGNGTGPLGARPPFAKQMGPAPAQHAAPPQQAPPSLASPASRTPGNSRPLHGLAGSLQSQGMSDPSQSQITRPRSGIGRFFAFIGSIFRALFGGGLAEKEQDSASDESHPTISGELD